MAKERGVMKMLWNSFVSALKPRFGRRKLIGEDYYGTMYYEEEIRHSARKRPPRYFVPANKDFEQELPAEWEAWLRYRRKDPPTREEMETNYQLALTKKQNAAKLLEENRPKSEGTRDLPASSDTQTATPGNFPAYEDYKSFGSNYKPKDSYK